MGLEISNQYLYTGRGPFDAKSLVKTYADLLLEKTWQSEAGNIIAYNGMVVAVWLNKEDVTKNGIYYLHDSTITSTFKAPDVTKETNWHKLAGHEDISRIVDELTTVAIATGAATDKLAGIETTVTDYVASVINTVKLPKASNEITMSEDGTLGLGEVSLDKLVQGAKTIVFSGGTALS